MKQNILIIGSGGREHALAWKVAQSPRAGSIYIAPGNAGTAQVGENVQIRADDFEELTAFVRTHDIHTTIVGPDDPLALGVVDYFTERGLRIWGPSQQAARIESSKASSKALMQDANIPTAAFDTFTDFDAALSYAQAQTLPLVVKASGLALGKGVTICSSYKEAEKALHNAMVDKIFGEAGAEVVIEEFLEGEEFSLHAFCDGTTARMFPSAQDHKQAFDGDVGPNTGGMGTIAPVPWVSDTLMHDAERDIIKPIMNELKASGAPFIGCLYPGVMMTELGPRVLEFNARFGDPETQSYMRLLDSDLLSIINACIDGTLAETEIAWKGGYACCIVLASGGYPGAYEKGKTVSGIEEAEQIPDVVVFHAGTGQTDDALVTAGGRALGVTAVADTLEDALEKAYKGVACISFEGMQYRRDIGKRTQPQL